MAVFYLQHTGKGKAKYDRQGIVDHGRYVLRQAARGVVEARHAPSEYGAVLGWLGRQYDESRANARVIDSIIVNLPRELDASAQAELLRTFLDTVTERRAPYLFVIHTDKPDNPHAHIIVRDVDIHTGRRVAGLSKIGSSQRLRALWEALCNDALRNHGLAISRHGQHSEHHRRINEEVRNVAAMEAAEAAQGHQTPPAPLSTMGLDGDDRPLRQKGHAMADIIQFPDQPPPPAHIQYNLPDIESVLATDKELSRVKSVREQLTTLKADNKATQTQLDSVIKRMGDLAANVTKLTTAHTSAEQAYADYQRWGLFLRGIKIGQWRSPKRIRAERARDNYKVATEVLQHTSNRLEAVRKEHRILQKLAARIDRAESHLRTADVTFGTDAEIRDAEVILRNTLHMYADRVRDDHIVLSLARKDISPEDANRLRRVMAEREVRGGYEH